LPGSAESHINNEVVYKVSFYCLLYR